MEYVIMKSESISHCHVWLFATLWTVICQAPPSMEFSRQEYWSGSPCLPLGDFLSPRFKPRCPALQADSLPSEPSAKPHVIKPCAETPRTLPSWKLIQKVGLQIWASFRNIYLFSFLIIFGFRYAQVWYIFKKSVTNSLQELGYESNLNVHQQMNG